MKKVIIKASKNAHMIKPFGDVFIPRSKFSPWFSYNNNFKKPANGWSKGSKIKVNHTGSNRRNSWL